MRCFLSKRTGWFYFSPLKGIQRVMYWGSEGLNAGALMKAMERNSLYGKETMSSWGQLRGPMLAHFEGFCLEFSESLKQCFFPLDFWVLSPQKKRGYKFLCPQNLNLRTIAVSSVTFHRLCIPIMDYSHNLTTFFKWSFHMLVLSMYKK